MPHSAAAASAAAAVENRGRGGEGRRGRSERRRRHESRAGGAVAGASAPSSAAAGIIHPPQTAWACLPCRRGSPGHRPSSARPGQAFWSCLWLCRRSRGACCLRSVGCQALPAAEGPPAGRAGGWGVLDAGGSPSQPDAWLSVLSSVCRGQGAQGFGVRPQGQRRIAASAEGGRRRSRIACGDSVATLGACYSAARRRWVLRVVQSRPVQAALLQRSDASSAVWSTLLCGCATTQGCR